MDEERARLRLEADYREYFTVVRGWKLFPMQISYDAVLEFVEWLRRRN